MFKRNAMCLMAMLVMLLGATASRAQEGAWVYLGQSHLDGVRDHDKIKIDKHYGRFNVLQIRVTGGAVEFDHVLIHFRNGAVEELSIRQLVHDGQRTRPIVLPGGHRIVKNVEFWYSQDDPHYRPTIQLFGAR